MGSSRAGLGIAFRNRAAEVSKIAVVSQAPGAGNLARALAMDKALSVSVLDSADAEHRLRTGQVALIAVPLSERTVEYRYDDTRPEARTARMVADASGSARMGPIDPL